MNNYWLNKSKSEELVVFPCLKNEISFFIEQEELIKITANGFYVKGKLVAEDKEVYNAFIDFLNRSK